MKNWTHKHTLVTIGVVAIGAYLAYHYYQKSTAKMGKLTPPAGAGDKGTTSFVGSGADKRPYVHGFANPYQTGVTNREILNGQG